jgi:hypothetical protein
MLRDPAALGFNSYLTNVLRPVVNRADDKDALAVWLNRQLDEWELEAERAEGLPFARDAIDALEQILDAIESAPTLRAARHGKVSGDGLAIANNSVAE